MNTKKLTRGVMTAPLLRLFLLALFFFGGVLFGQVLAGRVPDETGMELQQYLEDYIRLGGEPSARTAISAAVQYFRYPLLAFALGFASIGVVLLPLSAAVFGFFLSFAVCCFTAAFGPDGVLLALAAMGLRCLVTVPCYFYVALAALDTAVGLAVVSFGSGRRTAPVVYGLAYWKRLGVCCVALAVGVCGELTLTPALLRLALERLFS